MQTSRMNTPIVFLAAVLLLTSSCGFSITKTLSDEPNPYLNSSVEPLKRSEYNVLDNTTGYANSKQLYLLFFPIGKSKTTQELESNAYYDAVDNCKGADALILPKTEYKRFSIPLILLNYTSRKITVKGRGIQLKEDSGK